MMDFGCSAIGCDFYIIYTIMALKLMINAIIIYNDILLGIYTSLSTIVVYIYCMYIIIC